MEIHFYMNLTWILQSSEIVENPYFSLQAQLLFLFTTNYWLKYDFLFPSQAEFSSQPPSPHVITWIEWNGGNYTNERKIINSTFSEILKIIRQKVWIRNGYCSWQRSASQPSRQNNNNQHLPLLLLLLSLNLGHHYSLVFWSEIVKNARNPRNPTCKIGDLIFDDCWIGWD